MRQRGQALIILLVVLVLAMVGLFALCNDDDDDLDGIGRVTLISHERARCWDYDDCDSEWDGQGDYGGYGSDYGHNRRDDRNRNRGAFSPGPFDRSPIDLRDNCVSLDCSGRDREDRRRDDNDERNRVAGRAVGGRGVLRIQQPHTGNARADERQRCPRASSPVDAWTGLRTTADTDGQRQLLVVRGSAWQAGCSVDDDTPFP